MDNQMNYDKAKLWQIGCFSMNNVATNCANFLMAYYAYYTQNVLGLAAVIVGMIATCTRIFDGITDPIVGFWIDRTDGRFGKFRPFMLGGNIIIGLCLLALFRTPVTLSLTGKYIYTTVMYFLYIIGYTFQTICTKGAQTILTNDPKQRPIFTFFDGFGCQIISAIIPFLITTYLAKIYSVGEYAPNKGMVNPELWKTASLIIVLLSVFLTILAIAGIWEKDRSENFTSRGNAEKVKVSAYLDITAHNRPLQMLIVSAATDKLGSMLMGGTLTYIFANILLNSSMQGKFSMMVLVPSIIFSFLGVVLARKVGLKRCFLTTTWISLILLTLMFILKPNPEVPFIFLGLYMLQKCVTYVSMSTLTPLIADCSDYETYRSGRYVPGMVATIFSFIDKLLSSLSTLIVGFALAYAGVGAVTITPNEPVNAVFNNVILICFCIVPILGHIATLIAMRFYDLTKEKMEEVQHTIVERKRG